MYKHLFFDDRYVFGRTNTKRSYGEAELLEDAVYCDEIASTAWPGAWVFRLDSGEYRMLFQACEIDGDGTVKLYSTVSRDGIHFNPEDLTGKVHAEGRNAKHEVMTLTGEAACILEDPYGLPEERYKMLFTEVNSSTILVEGQLYVSEDLLHWRKAKNVYWSEDGEPVTGAFYNSKKKCYTILRRPAWGIRMVGYTETEDWRSYTKFVHCLQTDSLDAPLEEIYGMPAFSYDGWFIGFPHIYGGFGNSMGAKFNSGTMKAQLAYSHNGTNWFRSLRESFISGTMPDKSAKENYPAPMVWPSCIRVDGDSIYIYACAALLEHGPAFGAGANGRIHIYKLRRDGFIRLESEDPTQESMVATRENVWHGGSLHVNLNVQNATVAVYTSDRDNGNILGICEPIEGYGHEDCIPFQGDSCDWIPTYKSGKTLDKLQGRILAFEIKFQNGELYALSGNMTPIFNVEGERYRTFHVFAETDGFDRSGGAFE